MNKAAIVDAVHAKIGGTKVQAEAAVARTHKRAARDTATVCARKSELS